MGDAVCTSIGNVTGVSVVNLERATTTSRRDRSCNHATATAAIESDTARSDSATDRMVVYGMQQYIQYTGWPTAAAADRRTSTPPLL